MLQQKTTRGSAGKVYMEHWEWNGKEHIYSASTGRVERKDDGEGSEERNRKEGNLISVSLHIITFSLNISILKALMKQS